MARTVAMLAGACVAVACDEGIDSVRVGVAVGEGVLVGIIASVGKGVVVRVAGIRAVAGNGASKAAVATTTDDAGACGLAERGQAMMTSQAPMLTKTRPVSCLMRLRAIYPVRPLERINTNAAPPAIIIKPMAHNNQLLFDAADADTLVGGNADAGSGVSEAVSTAVAGTGVSEAVSTTVCVGGTTISVAVGKDIAVGGGVTVSVLLGSKRTTVALLILMGVIPAGRVGGTGVGVSFSFSGGGTLVRHGTVPPHPP